MTLLLTIFIWAVFICWTYQFVILPAIHLLIQSKLQLLNSKLDNIRDDVSQDDLEALEITGQTIDYIKKLTPQIDITWMVNFIKSKSNLSKDIAFNQSKKEWYVITKAKDQRITDIADEAMIYFSVIAAANSLLFLITTFPFLLIIFAFSGTLFNGRFQPKAAIIAQLHRHI